MERLHLIGAAALLFTSCERVTPAPTPVTTSPSEPVGKVLSFNCSSISGWVKRLDGSSIRVYADGYFDQGVLVGMDSPNENQIADQVPFSIPIIDPIRDGKLHQISVINSIDDSNQELDGSPQTLNCPVPKSIDNLNGVMQVGVNDRVGLVNNTETAVCTGRFTREDDQKPNLTKEADQAINNGGLIKPDKYQLSDGPGNRIGWGPC